MSELASDFVARTRPLRIWRSIRRFASARVIFSFILIDSRRARGRLPPASIRIISQTLTATERRVYLLVCKLAFQVELHEERAGSAGNVTESCYPHAMPNPITLEIFSDYV